MAKMDDITISASVENESGKSIDLEGKEYLDIDISVGTKLIANFTLRHTDETPDGGSGWAVFDSNDEPIYWIEDDDINA